MAHLCRPGRLGVLGRGVKLLTRSTSSLSSNPHIRAFPAAVDGHYFLTLLPTNPPNPKLAIGTAASLPPKPSSFRENPGFVELLNSVLAENAHLDAGLAGQARALAGPGGTFLGSASGGGGGAGGAGGAGRGGFVHLGDSRNPPDYGRIAWPEDIFGSVEVDGAGNIIGRLQPSGTYRMVTNEGILGLSDFLREKLVERLRLEETKRASDE